MKKGDGTEATELNRVLAELARHGLLLKQDKVLPSVVGLVTGEALSGAWWAHARANEIYALLEALFERADVLESKLILGKVTFVAQSLWPAWLGVATSAEPWQRTGLSPAATRLFTEVTRGGEHEASGPTVKELEERLLVRSEQRHTASGRHVLRLESWPSWAARKAVTALPLDESRRALEAAARSLGAPSEALPWLRKPRRKVAKR